MTSIYGLSPRERLRRAGPEGLSNAELLSTVLRGGDPGKPATFVAEQLLDEAGGLPNLLEGCSCARPAWCARCRRHPQLMAVLELATRAMGEQLAHREVLANPKSVRTFVQIRLSRKAHECFAVLFLDAQNRLIRLEEMFRGTLSQTSVYPREVVVRALELRAASVVLAHNHPSGSVQPSRSDEALTHALKAALSLVDVRVLDHIIVAPGLALSMAEKGLL